MLNGRNQFRLHCLGVIYFKSAVSLANVINEHCGGVNPPCDVINALRAKILTTTQAQLAFHAPDIKAIECCGQRGRISRTKVHFTLRQQHFTIIMTELISVSAPQGCGGDVPCGICVFMQKGIAPTRNSIIIKIFLRQKGGHSNASLSRTVDII